MNAEQIEVNLRIARVFEELGVPYFIGGSMASSVHGIYRATNDADFIADLKLEHVSALISSLGTDFYAAEDAIRTAVRQRQSFNLIHLNTMLKVDVFVMKTAPFSMEEMARRGLVPIGAPPAPQLYVASPEDTVLSKLQWYRRAGESSDRQWGDILGVLKVQRETIDQDYLRRWAAALSISDLLERAFDEAGLEPF